jgi:RNA polymerase sigma-70 factor (ECF subfamily)
MTDEQGTSPEDQATPTVWVEDDEALARMVRQNPAAFAELYRRHANRVYRYLLAQVGDVHQAQDLAAQTFLAALEDIGSYRGQGRFAAWLLTIARHTAADYFRRQRRRVMLPLEAAAQVIDPDPPLEQLIAARLRLEQVMAVLPMVAPERAEALMLRIFSELSVAEVAEVMGKSEAAVRMLIHRAVHDLQKRLAFSSEAEP